MTTKQKTFEITPEQAYRLVLAALDVVGSVSPGVHDRIKRDVDAGRGGSNPSVSAKTLVALRQVLNDLSSGGLADRVITEQHAPAPAAGQTKLCNICRVNRVPVGTHACAVCE